jgi:hypothetical protein
MGVRTVLLIAAVVLFILDVVANDGRLGTLGLACFAGGFLADDLGFSNVRVGGTGRAQT